MKAEAKAGQRYYVVGTRRVQVRVPCWLWLHLPVPPGWAWATVPNASDG